MFLSEQFLNKYKELQFPGTEMGEFVYLRTYSRWIDAEKRREKWWETVRRVVEYSISLYSGPRTNVLKEEAELLYDLIFNLKIFPAGRTLWVGGTEAARRFPSANYNCSFKIINSLASFSELFYLLLVGTGVGFRILPDDVKELPRFNTEILLTNMEYIPVPKNERRDRTIVTGNGAKYIAVGDSKEGWITALGSYLQLMTSPDVKHIYIDYNTVRPRGELLKTFGGRASGPDGLAKMFSGIHKIITRIGKLYAVDCLDICNMIGEAVVVGGVRRTSEIALFDITDPEVLNAKLDLWQENTPNYGKFHRSMSNNTIFLDDRPNISTLHNIFKNIRNNGEPGLLNAAAANLRRPNFHGINPCVTEDTWVLTDKGERQVKDLIGVPFNIIMNGRRYSSTDQGFWNSGYKPVIRIRTLEGFELKLTDNHKILTTNNEWIEAGKLLPGDEIIISNNRENLSPVGISGRGWLLGELVGDGTFGTYANLDFWGDTKEFMSNKAIEFIEKKRSDNSGTLIKDSDKIRVQSAWLSDLANEYGITRHDKFNTELIERSSSPFVAGFIRGLFDSDGTVVGNPDKGVSVRLSSIHLELLQSVQRMLLRFGIYSKIYKDRRYEAFRSLPDGKGGYKEYFCKTSHELVISKDNLLLFRDFIGFFDPNKMEKLNDKLTQFSPYSTTFIARFNGYDNLPPEKVYDCTIPDANCFPANGIIAHNCAEILLDDRGLCNLSTINLMGFVENGILDQSALLYAVTMATRIGLRQTNVDLELPDWDLIQKRDRLVGVSVTGYMDMLYAVNAQDDLAFQNELLTRMNSVANQEASSYAAEMRIPAPLLVTTVKPEGTISQLPTVSSGIHMPYAPYYIRRIRISGHDPLAKVMHDLNYPILPENGSTNLTPAEFTKLEWDEQETILSKCDTWVIEFPVKTAATVKSTDETAIAQFKRYLQFQKHYTDHNTSITITVGDNEWDNLITEVYENWDQYIAISFLPKSTDIYPLMPYEAITEEEYNARMKQFVPANLAEQLEFIERQFYSTTDAELDPSCETGVCAPR